MQFTREKLTNPNVMDLSKECMYRHAHIHQDGFLSWISLRPGLSFPSAVEKPPNSNSMSLLILTWSQDEYSNRRIAPASRNSDKVAGLNMSVGELLQQIRLSVIVSDIYEEIYQP